MSVWQDTVELHVHGSIAVVSKVMSLLGNMRDLVPAPPGHFTKMAFTNGKLDLPQVALLIPYVSAGDFNAFGCTGRGSC